MKYSEFQLFPALPQAPDTGDDRGTQRPDTFLLSIGTPTVTVYFPVNPNGTSVIICPGGGYGGVSLSKEGHDVARVLANWGVTPIVLKYRVPGGNIAEPPIPLVDAWQALRVARANAAAWQLDPTRIGIMGFSAGGHLALTAALHPGGPAPAGQPCAGTEARAHFQILVYPVVTFLPPHAHAGSRNNLIGADAAEALVDYYSGERQVTPQTPPAFLVHADDDSAVPVANSLMFADALRQAGVAVELVRHPTGGHGFGMGFGAGFANAPDWMPRLNGWLGRMGLLGPEKKH
jgi:acetyl esterase/lipase